jgi:hypothetical protein
MSDVVKGRWLILSDTRSLAKSGDRSLFRRLVDNISRFN